MATEATYENAILEGFFGTWRTVQHDIETTLRTGVNLHAQIVERWYQYLDHVDRVVQRAKTTTVHDAVINARAEAVAPARVLGVGVPPVQHVGTTEVSHVGANLSDLPHTVASDVMVALHEAPKLRDKGVAGAALFHRATANAATPMLSRSMVAARTEIERAGRAAVRQWLRASPDVFRGWWWDSSPDLADCPSCWAMHGTGHGLLDELNDHPNGNCKIVPWLHHEDLPTPGADRFAKLPEDDQLKVLGHTRMALYRSGSVELPSMVTVEDDPKWGPSTSTTPIRMLDKAQARR